MMVFYQPVIRPPSPSPEALEKIHIQVSNLLYNSRSVYDFAGLAQLVEQLICNQQVGGSKPLASFYIRKRLRMSPV